MAVSDYYYNMLKGQSDNFTNERNNIFTTTALSTSYNTINKINTKAGQAFSNLNTAIANINTQINIKKRNDWISDSYYLSSIGKQ